MATIIASVGVAEGPLYVVNTEDGPQHTFDCSVIVTLPDGREFVHPHHFSGKGYAREIGAYVAQSRAEAKRLADRVEAAGEINLERWELVDRSGELSLRERLDLYAEEEAMERAGQPFTPYSV